MRDMSATSLVFRCSPHVGEHFAAYAGVVRLLVGQQALRCGDDRDTQATEHLRQSGRLRIHPQPRLRDPPDTRDRALPVLAVLQRDRQGLADLALRRLVDRIPRDVALARQDLRDSHLDLAVWHGRGPHPGQHVRNWICHCHCYYFFLNVVSSTVRARPSPSRSCWVSSCPARRRSQPANCSFRPFSMLGPGAWMGLAVGRAPRGRPVAPNATSRRDEGSTASPARLRNARQLALVCHVAYADAAQPKLAVDRLRPTAPLAPGVRPYG